MKAYPDYKKSGVEWIGEIPEHWITSPVRYLTKFVTTGGTPKEQDSFSEKGEVNWFTPGDFKGELRVNNASKKVTSLAVKNKDAKIYPEKSVIVIGIGATLGKVAYCELSFSCNQQINILAPNNRITYKFLSYSLSCQMEQMKLLSNSSTIGIMNQEKTKNIQVALPNINDQEAIVSYLDSESTRIDKLISEKQNFIKLLQEKRQALISHVVTKGLNPKVKMKDSGVEWIGEIPEYWEVKKIKHVFHYITDKESCKNKFTIALENIESKTGNYVNTDSKYDADGVPFINGDTLFGKLRPYLEKVYFCKEDGMSFGDILVFRPNDKLDPEFGYYLMSNSEMIKIIDSSTFGTKMPRANPDYIRNMWHSIPSKREQREIVKFLNKKLISYQKIQDETKKSVELLKEHRTALISAAVTGKIDVRENT